MMKKTGSKGFLFLSVLWIILSLLWFFWLKSTVVGIIWLCAGTAELVIALVSRKKSKK